MSEISTAARRIAKESEAGTRVFFSDAGEIIGKAVGPEAFSPACAVETVGKVTQRRAQDLLDAHVFALENPEYVRGAAISIYLTEVACERENEAGA